MDFLLPCIPKNDPVDHFWVSGIYELHEMILMHQKEFDDKNDNTADDGYREKTGTTQGSHDTCSEG